MDVYAELSMDDILDLPNDDYFYSSSSSLTTTTCFDPSYYYPNLNDVLSSVPGGDMEDLGWLSSSVGQSYTSLPTNINQLTTTTAAANNNNNTPRRCTHCASEKTPQWRTGPQGPKTLCNACGVRYKSGRLVPEYRPASSPTFVLSQHSNSHRKVMELRRQKQQEIMSLTNKGHHQQAGHERHFSLC